MDTSQGAACRGWRRGRVALTSVLATICFLTSLAEAAEAMPTGTAPITCGTSWLGGTGMYSNPLMWSNGVPTAASNVCITIPGTYQVIINGAASANTITLGGTNAAPTLVIQGVDNCGSPIDASLTLANGGSEASGATIDLTHAGACANGASSLTVSGGTFINHGGITSDPGTASSPRYIDGNITNRGGTVNINTTTTYGDHQAGTFDNQGKVILNGSQLQFGPLGGFPSTFKNDAGSISNLGTTGQLFVGGPNAPSDTFVQGAGSISVFNVLVDPTVVLDDATLQYLSSISRATAVVRGPTRLIGGPSKGQTLVLEATDNCNGAVDAVLNSEAGFTNAGVIKMTQVGPCSGGQANITVPGTLTNQGKISTVAGTAGITGTLSSTGTVSVGKGTTLVLNGALGNYDATTGTLNGGLYSLGGTFQVTDSAFALTDIVNNNAVIVLAPMGKFIDANGDDALRPINQIGQNAEFAPAGSDSTIGSLTNDGTLAIRAGKTFTVNGSYTQGSSGTLQIGLTSPPNYGSLTSTGPASLDGTLDLNAPPSFNGGCGQADPIITVDGVTGSFAEFKGRGLGQHGVYVTLTYSTGHVWATMACAIVESSATTGAPISPFTLNGTGFLPYETIGVTFGTNSNQAGLSPAIADSNGAFTQGESVPGFPPGTYSITLVGQTSGATVVLPFTVT